MINEEKPALLPLHPKELSDEEFSIYEAEFEKVLNDHLCRNIALTGPYGAGKSSVIEKVKKQQQKRGEKWITISLATFGEATDEQKPESALVQNAVEAEILRQMVHKIGTSMAPKSRFRKLDDHKRPIDMLIAVLLLAFALLTIYLSSISTKLFSLQLSYTEDFAFGVWLTIAGAGIYRLIRTNGISKIIRRVKLFEAEFEITPSDSESPYERCADEIVYLLNASKVNAVVFEDLDRFDSMTIFERMRSLNALSNDSRFSDTKKTAKEEEVKPLKFFFLVRDGLFENPHDRTKFFDHVIPVVPYIDPNSSLDIFRNALGGVGITVDEEFLYQLSLYIDDPRIIYDIANEAYHYKKTLFETRSFTDGDPERLVALLAYKALFPKDFELLQVGRGYLREVLNGKQRFIDKLIEDDKVKCEELQKELDSIERQLEVNEDELICMYGAAKMQDAGKYLGREADTEHFDPHSFLEAARNDGWAARELKPILQQLQNNSRYQARLLEVRGDANRRSRIIQDQIKELRARFEAFRPMTIKQLIDELPNADALFYFSDSDIERKRDFEELSMSAVLDSPSFPMLRFLVSSGYIDESYRRYMSNFYSDTLCAEDDDFLSAIRQAKSIDLAYQPKAPNEIVRRMSPDMFSRTKNRNPWLISALLDSENEKKINAFMSSVKRSGGVRYLAEFIASEQFNPGIFMQISAHFDTPIALLLDDEGISADDKRCFCKRCLANDDGFRLLEKEKDIFTEFIDSDAHFLEEDSRFDNAELENGLCRIGYRTEAIDFPHAGSALLDFVYSNCLFMPAPSIIDGYLDLKYEVNGSMGHGTLITEALKLSDCPIKDVVSNNMEYFVSSVARESKAPLRDASESVVSVLNEKSIQAGTAERYIERLADVEIENIDQVVSADYRNKLLTAGLIECNADNIISCYQLAGNTISDDLARLIETKGAPSDLSATKCEAAGVDEEDIVSKIIKCKIVSVENKKAILTACGFTFTSFDIKELDDETVRAMIETKAIEMNGDMLDKFRVHKPGLELDYILSNLDGFLALVGADSPDEAERKIEGDEVLDLLKSNIDTSKKLTALSCFDGAIRIDKSYEAEVNAAIVAEHFELNDMLNLPSYYQGATEEFRNQIAEVFAKSVETVFAKDIEFGWDLLQDSLNYLNASRERALRLLTWYFRKHENEINRDKVARCFETAGLSEYTKLIRSSRSMIPKSSYDDAMLSILSEFGMCGTVLADVNKEGLRNVYSKGYKRKE